MALTYGPTEFQQTTSYISRAHLDHEVPLKTRGGPQLRGQTSHSARLHSWAAPVSESCQKPGSIPQGRCCHKAAQVQTPGRSYLCVSLCLCVSVSLCLCVSVSLRVWGDLFGSGFLRLRPYHRVSHLPNPKPRGRGRARKLGVCKKKENMLREAPEGQPGPVTTPALAEKKTATTTPKP